EKDTAYLFKMASLRFEACDPIFSDKPTEEKILFLKSMAQGFGLKNVMRKVNKDKYEAAIIDEFEITGADDREEYRRSWIEMNCDTIKEFRDKMQALADGATVEEAVKLRLFQFAKTHI